MSPLIHYPRQTCTAFTTLGGLTNLLPQGGIEGASANQILYATNARVCDAVRNSDSAVVVMEPNEQVILRRLERGYYYQLKEALPGLEALNEAIGTGSARVTDANVVMNDFDPGKRQLGTLETNPIDQALTMAPFLEISPAIASSGALIMAKAAEISLLLLTNTIYLREISDAQEMDMAKLVYLAHTPQNDGALKIDLPLAIDVLGLFAAHKSTPVLDNSYPIIQSRQTIFWKTVDELGLSVRIENCFNDANIKYVGQLVQKTEADLRKIRNFGGKAVKEIKEMLARMGLELGMKLDFWPLDGPQPPSPAPTE